jgi:hypothetical protein
VGGTPQRDAWTVLRQSQEIENQSSRFNNIHFYAPHPTTHRKAMYWPTSAARVLAVPQPLGRDPVLKIATSRRGNLFATLTSTCVGVWDVRVSSQCSARVLTRIADSTSGSC